MLFRSVTLLDIDVPVSKIIKPEQSTESEQKQTEQTDGTEKSTDAEQQEQSIDVESKSDGNIENVK